jgi:hypothetical protein
VISKNEMTLSVEELKSEVNRLKTKLDESFLLSFDTDELFRSSNFELIKIDERFRNVFNSFDGGPKI